MILSAKDCFLRNFDFYRCCIFFRIHKKIIVTLLILNLDSINNVAYYQGHYSIYDV